jgi:hypothetical protein
LKRAAQQGNSYAKEGLLYLRNFLFNTKNKNGGWKIFRTNCELEFLVPIFE